MLAEIDATAEDNAAAAFDCVDVIDACKVLKPVFTTAASAEYSACSDVSCD